jgi:CRP/FNR family transcriptional regulator, cyclic AMP receptor protein
MAMKATASFDAKTVLTKAGKGRSIIKCRKDEIVFSQGDPADAVFYIQKGRIKITVVSPQGKEAVIALLGSDEFFGGDCLSGQPRRMTTVRAIAESTIMRIEKADLARLIRDEPVFSGVHGARFGALHPARRRPGRSTLQLE